MKKIKWIPFLKYSAIIGIFINFSLLPSCSNTNKKPTEYLKESPSKIIKSGELLAQQYCINCHEFVAPEILPKNYWNSVLSKMSMYLGVNDQSNPLRLNSGLALKRIDSMGIFPTKQIITDAQWQSIKQYYLNESPEKLSKENRFAIDFNMSQFKLKPIRLDNIMREPTFVKILDKNKIGVGFSSPSEIHEFSVIDIEGNELQNTLTPSPLTSISQVNKTIYMSFMGSFTADDNPIGTIGKLKIDSNFNFKSKIEHSLPRRERPVHVNVIDSDNNGTQDLVVAEFGKYLGGLYLYVQDKSGNYKKKTLYEGPGAISSVIKDVNNDGLLDVYGLISQGNEGIYLYTNMGNNLFKENKLLTFPPYYGSTYFEVVDFDGDGFDDIIYTCGDSGDFQITSKPFHGIRLFKNYNNESFKEEWFYPQQGTYKINVIDFDQDGDLDIAAIGFFAYSTIPEEGFLYLENKGIMSKKSNFKTHSFKGVSENCYMVMDAGDIDNDGDIDLVLGSSTVLLGINTLSKQLAKWDSEGGLILVLENTLK